MCAIIWHTAGNPCD